MSYRNIYVEDKYSDNPTIHLFDDEEGYHKFDFPDYAYVRNEYGDYETMWGDPVMKVPKENLTYRKKRELWDVYGKENAIHESDVPVSTRILVDLYDDEEISEGHRRMFYDIEVSSEGGFPEPAEASNEITSLAYYDEARDKRTVLILDKDGELEQKVENGIEIVPYETEERLLQGILEHWREVDPTIITGWNCIPKGNFVWGEDRLLEVGSVSSDDGLSGAAEKVEFVFPDSKKQRYDITLADGTSVSSSGDHVFPAMVKTGKYTRLNEASSTCETKELTARELLEESRDTYLRCELGGNTNESSEYEQEEAYLAGLIYADGTMHNGRVSVYNTCEPVLEPILEKFGKESLDEVYKDERGNNPTYHLRTRSPEWESVLDLIYDSNGNKRLNVEEVSRLDPSTFFEFLSGLIDGDGTVKPNEGNLGGVEVCFYNEDARKLVNLLRWNGVDCSVNTDGNIIRLSSEVRDLSIYKSELNLRHPKKRSRLSDFEGKEDKGSPSPNIKKMRRDGYILVRVDSASCTEEVEEMVDIKTNTGYFNTSSGVKTHNCDGFDNPYLYNRLKKVLGEEEAKKLSPIEKVRKKRIGREDRNGYQFGGIASLDYLRIYKNFTFSEQASYSLDAISNDELGRGKVEYEGMEVDGETIEDLDDLKRLDIERFIKYNFEDVQLVADLDDKLNFIEMARRISHLGHVPYEEVYKSSRFIEGAILNRINEQGIVAPDKSNATRGFEADEHVPPGNRRIPVNKEIKNEVPRRGTIGIHKNTTSPEKVDYVQVDDGGFVLEEPLDFEVEKGYEISLQFAGAYVKEPEPGLYDWFYDLDLTSMYPCICMSLNISPETKVAKVYGDDGWEVDDFARMPDKEYEVWIFDDGDYRHFDGPESLHRWVRKNNYSVAANGAIYRNDKRGVIAEILEEWFENRQEYKQKRNEARERGDEEEAEYYDKQQHNRKILINSVYGVLGLPVFRFYDIDNAEATTATGVSTIKFTQKMGDHYYQKHGDPELGTINKCIYTDTDSVFYSAIPLLDDDPENMEEEEIIETTIEKATEVQEYLNSSYDYYARKMLNIPKGQHRFDIKQELVSSRGMWIRKKRYAQWIVNDEGDPTSELDVTGMDIIRSDFPPAFDSLLEELVITILREKDQDIADQMIMDFRDKLWDFDLLEVSRPTGIGEIEDYQTSDFGKYQKGAPAHYKAALAYNDMLEHYGLQKHHEPIQAEDKIKWIYLNKNPLGLDQIAFKGTEDPPKIIEFAKKYADYDKMYEKELLSKLQDVYEAIGWSFPSSGRKKAEQFFEF